MPVAVIKSARMKKIERDERKSDTLTLPLPLTILPHSIIIH